MTPKEKAEELIDKFMNLYEGIQLVLAKKHWAKQCALIAVDMIDDIYQKLTPKNEPYYFLFELEYWQEVKKEIENL